jgi:salicylate hydroxylase
MVGRLKIAVAGCGPAGLAAALLLHRQGHEVHLIERFDTPAPVGSGLILQPTGRCVLAGLGLDDKIAGLGKPIEAIDGRDAHSGRRVLDVDLTLVPHDLKPLAVHRGALFNVLYDAVVAEGIPVHTGCDVAGVARCPSGGVQVDNSGGLPVQVYDLVVDATGARSALKSLSVAPFNLRPLLFGALWATLADEGHDFAPNILHQRYRRADRMIGVLPVGRTSPVGQDLLTFFWSLKPGDLQGWRERGLAHWKGQVLALWPETEGLLGQISLPDQFTFATYTHHTMTNPWGDRIVFVGDAAHTTSPQLGQGANMALLDAHALALAIQQTSAIEEIGPRYAALRRWHLRLYQWMSAAFTPFYQSDNRLLPLVRDAGFHTVNALPGGRRLFAALVGGLVPSPLRKLALPPSIR